MNLTIIALSLSHLSISPMISPASYQYKSFLSFKKLQMHNFYSNFLKDFSRIANRDIIQCKFVNFLNPPVIIDNQFGNELVSRKTFIDESTFCNFETLTIIGCHFINCTHNENDGGAIEFKRENSTFNANITIYSSTFDRCSATDGSGGAIFVCNEKHTTDFVSSHTNVLMFNSSYCCYSKCSAYTEYTNNTHKGYGSVMFIFADKIDLFYSSSVECPYNKPSYGAQFDLKSENSIRSSYINASSSSSKYCSGMEYRNAKNGHFTFQTFINLTGGYISSFTELKKEQTIEMSFCNFVDNTIRKLDHQSSIIYVNNCSLSLSNFCFVGTKFDDNINFSLVYFDFDNVRQVYLKDSFIDGELDKYLNNIKTENISSSKYINPIKLLNLGNCEGEQSPPPTIFSSIFTPTDAFSHSTVFTQSNLFTKSNNFKPSSPFTKSNAFKPSSPFTKSNTFKPSSPFTKSNVFKPSSPFTKSNVFEFNSLKPTDRFTKSNSFKPSNPFTKSNIFEPTKPFTATSQFTPSNKFTSSDVFTFSNNFTQSKEFILIPAKIDEKSKISTGMKIGIGVAAACVAIIAIILLIILLIRRKKKNMDIESVDINEETGSSVVTANPLASMMNNDDPFAEEFKSNTSINQDHMTTVPQIKPVKSNVSLNKLPSAPQLNESLTNESIHHMPSSPSVGHINQNPSLHEVSSMYDINDNIVDS